MSTFLLDVAASAAVWTIVQASALLAAAAMAQAALRRASAATRHLVWTMAVAGLLALPAASLLLPEWPVPIGAAAPGPNVVAAAAPAIEAPVIDAAGAPRANAGDASLPLQSPPRPSWALVLAGVYAAGVIILATLLLLHRWRVRQFAGRATPVEDAAWQRIVAESAARMHVRRPVRLLRSQDRIVPVALGTLRPSIVIPSVADAWPDDRRRAVVFHEMAHVARRDCLTQTLAMAACALYWFHPAVWWVARRLRAERELACDDRVIAAGTEAREYAAHLLEIAYTFGRDRAPALAVSMARRTQIEGRLLAALDAARNRCVPGRGARLAAAALAAALFYPLATLRPSAAADLPIVETNVEDATAQPVLQASGMEPFGKAVGTEVRTSIDDAVETPMKAARAIVRDAAASLGLVQDAGPGTWELRPSDTEGMVHLRLVERNSSSGGDVPIARIEGLTGAQLTGAGGPVTFRLRRDAGTFTFEGVVRQGVGGGTFSFTPDPNFAAGLAKRGFAQPTAAEQYELARHDVGFEFIDELTKQGYAKPPMADLVRAGQHGVSVAYLREMGELGYRLGSLPPLIELRDHGVTPRYVRALAELGFKGLSAEEIRKARDHGVSPEFARAMRDAGYGSHPMADLIRARDHGVSPEFVRELGDAGHRKLALDQLIRVRDHGVSPEYVRELAKLGHTLTIDELIRARDHGVGLDFVREMAALGYTGLPMDALVRLRDHGVSPRFVRELQALGYEKLPFEDLVTLRDHGLTPERIRSANARAGTRLPVDVLKSLAR